MKMKLREYGKRWLQGDLDLTDLVPEAHIPHIKSVRREPESPEPKLLPDLEQGELRLFRKLYPYCAAVMGFAIIAVLLASVFSLPRFGGAEAPVNNEVSYRYVADGPAETGAVNMVAGMILDYRAFDTLGESHVLFTGVCVVLLLLETMTLPPKEARAMRRRRPKVPPRLDLTKDPILHQAALFVVPIIFLLGIYVVFNGHLSPGGGFSGGAIIGAGLILYSSAFGFDQTERFLNRSTYRTITFIALCFYSLSKCWSFYTGANHLESGIHPGTLGNIFSAGLILPLNIAVGAVVACTMYGLYSLFQRGKLG